MMQTPSQLARRSLIALVALLWLPLYGAAADPSWIERSNRNSAMVFEALGAFDPEFASYVGIERFDSAVIDLQPGNAPRFEAAARRLLERLGTLRKAERDPQVRLDLDI